MLEMLKALNNNEGLTLRNGKPITYKTGYQVADYGTECRTAEEALAAINDMGGNCGIWLSDGIFYVDHSFRIGTKGEALRIGREYNQISILRWRDMALLYC